ncbi:MAG: hypothetical protein EBX44_15400, partial [Betaproteobacteria bacterium]|nr:hypothetical protein [Betaproteobacteria bacterium]
SGIALHFSEIKGPVMDKLKRTGFLKDLHGQVFMTSYKALAALTPELVGKQVDSQQKTDPGAIELLAKAETSTGERR